MRKGTIAVLIGALCFVAFVFYALIGSQPLKLSQVRMVRSAGQVSVEGEVRNTGDDSGPLQVEVRYYDREGRTIANDVVAIGGLHRGDATHFSSTPRADRGVADFSIYLNHGRNPYGN